MELISLETLSKKFEVAGHNVNIIKKQENFFTIDGIFLYCDTYSYEYICKNLSQVGWIIGYDSYIPGSRWQPDDVEFIEDSHHTNINSAITRVCSLLIEQKLTQFDENRLNNDE